jgi:N-acyl-phosphatidylethanolamine-hydrolysing phospholipase D
VSIHTDVLSRSSLAIHYATFAGSEDEATYPIALLEEACSKREIEVSMNEDDGFGVSDVGEMLVIPVRPDVIFQDSKEV